MIYSLSYYCRSPSPISAVPPVPMCTTRCWAIGRPATPVYTSHPYQPDQRRISGIYYGSVHQGHNCLYKIWCYFLYKIPNLALTKESIEMLDYVADWCVLTLRWANRVAAQSVWDWHLVMPNPHPVWYLSCTTSTTRLHPSALQPVLSTRNWPCSLCLLWFGLDFSHFWRK